MIRKIRAYAALIAISAGLLTCCQHNPGNDHDHDHESHENHEHEGHDHEGHDHEGHDHEHEGHDHDHEGHGDDIHFTAAQAAAAGVETFKLVPSEFRTGIRTSGRIMASATADRIVAARTSGIVAFANPDLVVGKSVSAGQALFTVSARGMVDGEAGQQADIALRAARKEYERGEKLVAEKIISEREFAALKAQYEAAKAAAAAPSARSSVGAVASTSPESGYVVAIYVQPGQYVAAGEPLAVVSRNKTLQLRADLPQKYFGIASSITDANIVMPQGNSDVLGISDMKGRRLGYGQASAGSFFLPVTFEFNNPGMLVAGSIVEVYLLSEGRQDVLSVPVEALTEEQGLYYVYVKEGPETYHKHEVTLGARNGARVEILKGIEAGEEVVGKGAYSIKMASQKTAIPGHTHNH